MNDFELYCHNAVTEAGLNPSDFRIEELESEGQAVIRITARNEWLGKDVSTQTNIGHVLLTPFGAGHLAKIMAFIWALWRKGARK